ncbi:MAG: hypothetical protein ABEJ95_02870 [Candidatus Nanohalobium sp.]
MASRSSKLVVVFLLVASFTSFSSATEIESGSFQVSSTGTISEQIGFRPDYIEFITAQQIESTDFSERDPRNNDCPDNVNGWSEGSVVFDSSGVDKQFSIGMFRNSDSTNGHKVASSTSDVIKNLYVSQDGNQCGKLEVSVVEPLDKGFKVDVESKYSNYDEIVRYKAYQFPDNMEFDAGMVKISSEGSFDVNLGFQPANLHVRSGQQISGKDVNKRYWRSSMGRSKGYATLDENGNVISQQSIGTASSSDSTNAHRSIASDNYILNTVYVDQNANVKGRLRAKITGADGSGFTMQVDDKWSGTDEVFLYRAWGFSYYDFDIGYKVVDTEGTKSFTTGFEPDAIDFYAEQQIDSINQEVVTPKNSGCDNAGGWSNGFYETDDNRQWALATGRTSDSQNSHRYGSTTSYSIFNLYAGHNGGDCGNFKGSVTSTDSNGFNMDFSFDSGFDSNYDKEMVYYRAFNFRLAPPQVTSLKFYNSTTGHAFGLEANVSEGSNDVNSCDITASSDNGNEATYSGTVSKINSTHSTCKYEWIRYDDNSQWKNRHDNSAELLNLTVEINVSDVDGLNSQEKGYNTFPENRPVVQDISFSNYTDIHAFNVTAELQDPDASNPDEIESCRMTFSDGEGNDVTVSPTVNYGFGDRDQASCSYSNVNSSMPYPSGLDSGFQVDESIDVEVNVTDHHGNSSQKTESNTVPNSVPFPEDPEPRDSAQVTSFPVILNATVRDREGDSINATIYNMSGAELDSEHNLGTGDKVDAVYDLPEARNTDYTWKVELKDRWSARNTTFEFTKVIGRAYRSVVEVELNYSSMIVNAGSNRYVDLTVRNHVDEKDLTVNLTGVEAEFLDGSTVKRFPGFPASSSKSFTVRVTPDSVTDKDLKVVVENNELGVDTTETVPVTVLPGTTEERTVPGVGWYQLLFLTVFSTVLYSAVL